MTMHLNFEKQIQMGLICKNPVSFLKPTDCKYHSFVDRGECVDVCYTIHLQRAAGVSFILAHLFHCRRAIIRRKIQEMC